MKRTKKKARSAGQSRVKVNRRLEVAILPERNQFADEFLDWVGNDFKFDHAKGLAEWMKNSADAYATTTDEKEIHHHIVLRFRVANPKKNSVFECIDFVGMTRENVDNAFKTWGSATAAKRGKDVATFGGHGNGGKFYMRQMFARAHFITYRAGRLNIFGFDDKKRYGYAKDQKDVKCTLDDALVRAGLNSLDIPDAVVARWNADPSGAGFTVVRGENPNRFTGRSTVPGILERLRLHPQTRRILRHKPVTYLASGKAWGDRLELPVIEPRQGFEAPREFEVPRAFEVDGDTLEVPSHRRSRGRLVLRTSAAPLSRSTDLAAMNSIDVMGEVGCIGSYRMNELGFLRHAPESEFIMGELEAAFLEDSTDGSVSNDREKLVRNPLTIALLDWVRECVDEYAGELAEKEESQRKSQDLQTSAIFNMILDKWKNRFMQRLSSELFGGKGIGDAFGGTGGGGSGADTLGPSAGQNDGDNGTGHSGGDDNGVGSGESSDSAGGAGTERKFGGSKFPRVLLSSHDQDPLSPEGSELHCDPRHPPVYQRRQDIEAGIYWINTSRPFAERVLTSEGAESVRWREYLFQRYVDIILKQSVYELSRRNPEIRPDDIDNLIDEVTSKVHDAAASDLETFLFARNVAAASAGTGDGDGEAA